MYQTCEIKRAALFISGSNPVSQNCSSHPETISCNYKVGMNGPLTRNRKWKTNKGRNQTRSQTKAIHIKRVFWRTRLL